MRLSAFLAAGAAVCIVGCSSNSSTGTTSGATTDNQASATTTGTTPPETTTTGATAGGSTAGAATAGSATSASGGTTNDNVKDQPKAGDDVAVITTNYGTIIFKFLPDKAPQTVDNFKKLANQGFYNGSKFHRVIPGFMIQGGDPNSKGADRTSYGSGGPGYTVPDEFSDISHVRGIVSMANTGQPNSGGSQFFIVVKDSPFLDGKYSVFGYVVKGMDVADKIVALPRDPKDDPIIGHEAVMKSVKIEKWPVK